MQDKAIRIINFLPNKTPVQNIYKKDKILRIKDYIKLQNILFVRDCLENELPKAFNQYFTKAGAAHDHGTRSTTKNCIRVENTKTNIYSKDSLKSQSIKVCNNLQTKNDIDILDISISKAKTKIANQFLNSYTDR